MKVEIDAGGYMPIRAYPTDAGLDLYSRLYNFGPNSFHVVPGMKIAQLIIQPCLYEPVELGKINRDTERGDNGFGSTGI